MKLLLVLVILVCRELIVEELRLILTQPMRQWRDSILRYKQGKQISIDAILALIVLTPALLVSLLLVLASGSNSSLWTGLLILIVLVPIFIDRRLPSILLSYRQQWSDAPMVDEPALELKQARLQLVTVCLQEVFTPLFWFLLLDTAGVVVILVYYGLRLCAEQTVVSDVADRARSLMRVFDWLPSRLLALSFALVGQFVETWAYWLDNIRNFDLSAVEFVNTAAEKAVPLESGQALTPTLPMALVRMLAAYESLCYRSMFIWVVLFALHVVL